MIAHHIHDALAQVKRLQELILQKRQFMGYSGRARVACGVLVLCGAVALSRDAYPATPEAHLAGWGVVLALAVLVNYSCVAYWFLFDEQVRRNPLMLKPALDAVPALVIGAALSAALIVARQFDLLFGVWMSLYGLSQAAYRLSLPRGIFRVGLGYMTAGILYLFTPGATFLNPWPMGAVFCLGETAGGMILIRNERRMQSANEES